jgi:hypothetical protein
LKLNLYARGFRAGHDVVLYDVWPRDTFRLPWWAHVERLPGGRLRVRSNVLITVTRNGRPVRVLPAAAGETVSGS